MSLEQRYRWLLRLYPARFRATHEEHLLATLLDGSQPEQRWPSARDTASLLWAAHEQRLVAATGLSLWRTLGDGAALAVVAFASFATLYIVHTFVHDLRSANYSPSLRLFNGIWAGGFVLFLMLCMWRGFVARVLAVFLLGWVAIAAIAQPVLRSGVYLTPLWNAAYLFYIVPTSLLVLLPWRRNLRVVPLAGFVLWAMLELLAFAGHAPLAHTIADVLLHSAAIPIFIVALVEPRLGIAYGIYALSSAAAAWQFSQMDLAASGFELCALGLALGAVSVIWRRQRLHA